MGVLDDLRPASFRGAPFLCPRDEVEEGPNNIRHLYPASKIQYIEPNGQYAPEFKMTCVIHGNDWLSKFSRLRTALNKVGPGTLRHPTYGSQICSVKGPWRVARRDDDLGVLELDVTFWAASPAVYPGLVSGIAATISTLSGSAIASIFSAFEAEFRAPTSTFSQQYLSTLMGGVASTVRNQFASTSDVVSAANTVSREL